MDRKRKFDRRFTGPPHNVRFREIDGSIFSPVINTDMPAGRPRTNPELKKLAGNPGKRPIPVAAVVTGTLTVPKQLSTSALVIWKQVVGAMPANTFATTDAALLATFCEAVSDYWIATKMTETEGRYVLGSTKQMVIAPWAKDKAELARLIYTLSQRLYLDPVARQSLLESDLTAPDSDDEFGDFIH